MQSFGWYAGRLTRTSCHVLAIAAMPTAPLVTLAAVAGMSAKPPAIASRLADALRGGPDPADDKWWRCTPGYTHSALEGGPPDSAFTVIPKCIRLPHAPPADVPAWWQAGSDYRAIVFWFLAAALVVAFLMVLRWVGRGCIWRGFEYWLSALLEIFLVMSVIRLGFGWRGFFDSAIATVFLAAVLGSLSHLSRSDGTRDLQRGS